MPIDLDDVECRVLGVLIEKSLAQPGAYPMTLNAILLGANQKQNRDPVVEYTEPQVAQAVHTLERRQLVKQAPPAHNARANRFGHNVVERLRWDRRQQGVMAELLLRGRQTVGELRTRASRMTPLNDLEVVGSILAQLGAADPPFVRELPREPGRSTTRFEHLLGTPHRNEGAAVELPATFPSEGGGETALAERVEDLENRITRLERRVDGIARELGVAPAD